jgi:N-acetylneuraminate synthase
MGTAARDLKMARALIDVAVEAGADAVKFQTYKPSTTYVANAGQSDYLSENGIQESIMDIFADLAMPYEMLPELAAYAETQNILFMSSPFSVSDLQAIDPFTAIHKIASYEISHTRLIEAIAATGKPAVLSTGASDLADIEWAVQHFQSLSKSTLCLMQCTARYPAPLSSLNLGTIPLLRQKFGLPVGLSDHTRDPITGPLAAVALGANLIEKHYTLDNRLPGPDHAFAITAVELKQMVKAIRDAEQVVGPGSKVVQSEEEELFWYARRGLQAIKNIGKGELFEEGVNFDILRPGKQKRGVHSKHIVQLKGARSKRDIKLGDGIQLEDLPAQTADRPEPSVI